MHYIFLAQLFTTIFMTGLIWMVQVVHYPLMDGVGESLFTTYESRHTQTITWIVMPIMLLELGTAIALILNPSGYTINWLVTALILLVLIWISTAFLQVPMHQKLSAAFDAKAHQSLVQTNWIRTILWTLRSMILLYLVSNKLLQ